MDGDNTLCDACWPTLTDIQFRPSSQLSPVSIVCQPIIVSFPLPPAFTAMNGLFVACPQTSFWKTPKAKGQGNTRVDTVLPKLSSQYLYTHQYLLHKVSFENTSKRIHLTFMPACVKHAMVLSTVWYIENYSHSYPVGTCEKILYRKCPPGQEQIGCFL
jgi:hypothetical protein